MEKAELAKKENYINYCTKCEYHITNDIEFHEHYKTDFHRFNIKRQLANLLPLCLEKYLNRLFD